MAYILRFEKNREYETLGFFMSNVNGFSKDLMSFGVMLYYKTAQNIFIAARKWLKERLGLGISLEKSKLTNSI